MRDARAAGLTVPIILMGYYNPFMTYGDEAIVKDAVEAGANAFIIVDLPLEEAAIEGFVTACDKHGAGFASFLPQPRRLACVPSQRELLEWSTACPSQASQAPGRRCPLI